MSDLLDDGDVLLKLTRTEDAKTHAEMVDG